MGRYITVTITKEGLYQIGSRSWGDVGLIGRLKGGTASINTAYTIKKPQEAKTLFGESSALYESILLLFSNGATKVIVVPADATAQTPETFNGTGSLKEFTLAGIPAQPLDAVTVDASPKVEGEDFYVDYGNKKIYFYVAPPTGTGNVSVTYSKHTTTHIDDALDVLAEKDVQLICGAMMFDSALLSKIKDHCVAMVDSPRIGFYMLANGETTTTLATTLASELSILIAHKSLKDVASAVCGLVSGLAPWKDLTMKAVKDIEQSEQFTSTEIDSFDAVKIVTMLDPPKLTGSANVVSTGWTLDPTATLQFIDQVRVAHHLAGVLEFGLTNPNVIGEMKMNRNGLRELDAFMRGLLTPWVLAGEIDNFYIDNPALRLFEIDNPDPEDLVAIQNLQASRRLEGAYIITVQLIYSGTIIYIAINAALTGGV